MAARKIRFQGLPARILWVGPGDRRRLGLAFNEMAASGELNAPIVIGHDHPDSGSVASLNHEDEAIGDGSDAGLRLADAQRASKHRLGGDVGVAAPRRGRR